ncbi:phosphoribosyltransferase [Actinocorallia populi]|uniref:phosphoribosyltransferase n=1 Tax=Actinocorallia populi TaxID=2079200 RepID=UPI000D0975B9|nr:phosphoribosyltransferase [Actinocorallia populi]
MTYTDRRHAGRALADLLGHLRARDPLILGLPRGGVPVAFEVAQALRAPLDVIVVRKLGTPGHPELAMGAIGEGGVRVLNTDILRRGHISDAQLSREEEHEHAVLDERAARFRGGREPLDLHGRTVVIVDDGAATGSTARAACLVARARHAEHIAVAVPVASPEAARSLGEVADEVVCPHTPRDFYAVGQFYDDFAQTADDEVITLLKQAREAASPVVDREVAVQAGPVELAGHLVLPPHPEGIVLFAHGSGSSRHSPRNHQVARALNGAGLGTLLFDLLTRREEHDRSHVFDIPLLAGRLADTTGWLAGEPDVRGLPVGYFGASTGAAAALIAAAEPGSPARAVVSRGGRPDLAMQALPQVQAPTLLIVGGADLPVLDLNEQALARLRCEKHLAVVPGATHLFEEPGALEEVCDLASAWFAEHLR